MTGNVVYYKNILQYLTDRGIELGWTPKEKDIFDKLYDWYIQEIHEKADK